MSKEVVHNAFDQAIGESLEAWSSPPFPNQKVIPGRFCRLEPLDPTRHGSELFTALHEAPQNWTYLPYGPFETKSQFLDWIEKDCLGTDPQFYAVIRLPDQKALGMASYLRIAPEQGSIEVGHIHFSSELQQTPVASEAMYLMMNHVFELGYRRYEWKCDSLNAASRSAAQRLGFTFEGTFRQATIYKQRNRDTAWYSIIDSEWPVLREAHLQWLAPENFDINGIQKTSLGALVELLSASCD